MAAIHIIQYRAGWDFNDHVGKVQLMAKDGSWSKLRVIKNPSEFQVILDLLRNEHPIFHDTKSDVIRTTAEKVGEDE